MKRASKKQGSLKGNDNKNDTYTQDQKETHEISWVHSEEGGLEELEVREIVECCEPPIWQN